MNSQQSYDSERPRFAPRSEDIREGEGYLRSSRVVRVLQTSHADNILKRKKKKNASRPLFTRRFAIGNGSKKLDRSTRDFPHGVLLLSEHPITTKKKQKTKKKDGVAGAHTSACRAVPCSWIYLFRQKREKPKKRRKKLSERVLTKNPIERYLNKNEEKKK